jgi:hypothetical protein
MHGSVEESVLIDIEDLGEDGEDSGQRLEKPVMVRLKKKKKNEQNGNFEGHDCFQSFVPGTLTSCLLCNVCL